MHRHAAAPRWPFQEQHKRRRHDQANANDPEPINVTHHQRLIAEALIFPELGAMAADQWGSCSMDRCTGAVQRARAAGLCRAGDPKMISMALIWSVIGQAFHNAMTGIGSPFATKAAKAAHIAWAWQMFLRGAKEGSASF